MDYMSLFEISEVSLVYKRKSKTLSAIKSSLDAYDVFIKAYDEKTIEHREEFKILLLDTALNVLGVCCISQGGIDSTIVDIRLVFQSALLANASRLILCHNHPSGKLTRSTADDNLTSSVKQAAKIMGIGLEDHLIISKDGYYSYADEGVL